MATYKAEFLSHYYEGRLRPRHAFAFGYIDRFARLASIAPAVVNFLTQTPGLAAIAKSVAGMPPQRRIPAFASRSFTSWFHRRQRQNGEASNGKQEVILWPDTFNNYFFPQTAQAAVAVLESVGFRVSIPQKPLCCGRPLYDFGMLDRAKRLIKEILLTLRPQIAAGVPVVVLEPSCLAVFRDEMPNLFRDDEDAKRLCEQSYSFSEFFTNKAKHFAPPKLKRQAIVHGHCHQKALMKMDSEAEVLKTLGLDFEILDSGCCGMAGSFGFEKDHYDISIQIGELVLLPVVRPASPDTLIVANGFSCREQIAQVTNRNALHLAEVMQMAMRNEHAP